MSNSCFAYAIGVTLMRPSKLSGLAGKASEAFMRSSSLTQGGNSLSSTRERSEFHVELNMRKNNKKKKLLATT